MPGTKFGNWDTLPGVLNTSRKEVEVEAEIEAEVDDDVVVFVVKLAWIDLPGGEGVLKIWRAWHSLAYSFNSQRFRLQERLFLLTKLPQVRLANLAH